MSCFWIGINVKVFIGAEHLLHVQDYKYGVCYVQYSLKYVVVLKIDKILMN